ncbi:hypothetical protein G6514_000692 [Epicoccum nigrum]|nr:hypothetical protein G6514_000692 [Epicoccum nigrum]
MDSDQSKVSEQPPEGAQNTNLSGNPDQDVQIFQKVDVKTLPPHSTLVFVEQNVDKNGSTHRLALGAIKMASEQYPLWVYLTSSGGRDCKAHFVYQGGKTVPREQHDRFILVEPFCYLPTTLPTTLPTKNIEYSTLDTLIAYYFIVAGKWPKKPPTGGHGYISTPVLRKACSEVSTGMKTASRVREHNNMARQLPSSASTTLPALPLLLKRKHDDSDLAAPSTKRVAIATDKVQILEATIHAQKDQLTRTITKMQLLEAEVNTLEKERAAVIEDMRKVLNRGKTHSIWASDILKGKIISEAAKGSAEMALDADMEELGTMIRKFEAVYGKVDI